MNRSTRSTRAQAMAEFALVAPLFFILLFAIIEFGRAVYYIQMLNNAAREGARYAIVHGADSLCPSGPLPGTDPNPCDPNGDRVVDATKTAAIAIIDAVANDFDVVVRWCDGADTTPTPTGCPDMDPPPGGDGRNNRGQNVDVTISYTYHPIIADIIPILSFTLTGGSTLVINH